MPSEVVHLSATLTCVHAGSATPSAPFGRVLVSGQPVVTPLTLSAEQRRATMCS